MRRLRPKPHEESSKGYKEEGPDRFWSLIVAETNNASLYRVMPPAKKSCRHRALKELALSLFQC